MGSPRLWSCRGRVVSCLHPPCRGRAPPGFHSFDLDGHGVRGIELLRDIAQALNPKLQWTTESTVQAWPALRQAERHVSEADFMSRFEPLLFAPTSEGEFDVLIGRLHKLSKERLLAKSKAASSSHERGAVACTKAAARLLGAALDRTERNEQRKVVANMKRNGEYAAEDSRQELWIADVQALGKDGAAIKRLQRELSEAVGGQRNGRCSTR